MVKSYSKIIILSLIYILGGTSVLAQECPLGFKRPSYKTRGAFCSTGEFVKDAYNFDKNISCEEMEVDHLIPLKLAHCAGLSDEQLKRLANDPRNLKFTFWLTNRSKGAKDLYSFVETLDPKIQKKILVDGVNLMNDYKIPLGPQLSQELARRLALTSEQLAPSPNLIKKRKMKDLLERMTRRVGVSMARGVAAAQPQAVTGVLAPMALAMIAWEVYDACQQIKDLNEMKQINSGTDVTYEKVEDEGSCGMSRAELFQAFTGKDAAFEECVKSRLQTGESDPPECRNYPIKLPHKTAAEPNIILLELPHNQ